MALLRLVTSTHPPAELDTAVSSAILSRVATGELPATLRLFVPGRVVAFGSQDRTRPRYPQAVAAARAAGFAAVERLAGGRAAVFHEGTIAFAWATPHDDSKLGIAERFGAITAIAVDAMDHLGLIGSVGETPGEYCPGRFSVHSGGRKVMGVGQRLVAGAAHVGGVLVVHSPHLVNAPLVPAYRHLGYDWSPSATGSLSDDRPITVEDAMEAMVGSFRRAGHDLAPADAEQATLDDAAGLAAGHAGPIA